MAESNVDLVRRTIDLFNTGEIERALAMAADDFVMDWENSIGPLKGVYTGREGVIDLWSTFLEAWESVRWDAQEITEVDETRVLVVNHVAMRGKGSGVDVEASGVQLWTLEDGVGKSIKLFQSKDEALAAL